MSGSLKRNNFSRSWVSEAVVQRCFVKKVFLEISQNSHKHTCARASFNKVAGFLTEHLRWLFPGLFFTFVYFYLYLDMMDKVQNRIRKALDKNLLLFFNLWFICMWSVLTCSLGFTFWEVVC